MTRLKVVADPEPIDMIDVGDAIAALSEEAMVCRDLMHAWLPYTASYLRESRRVVGYERVLRCRVCTTERREVLDSNGAVVSRSYQYPENYLVKGVGRFSGEYKDAARLANIHSMIKRG